MKLRKIAIGTFDGLHTGHMAVLEKIKGDIENSFALTFNLPPKQIEEKTQLLMSYEEKNSLIKEMGITPVTLNFNKIKEISAEDFLKYLLKEYSPSLIVTGFNFKFGKGAAGDVQTIKKFCIENSVDFFAAPEVKYNKTTVSSTNIRNYIKSGEVEIANKMLGRCFGFCGEIIHGDKRGRTLGFPTINQAYPENLVTPRLGVYSGHTYIDGKEYVSLTNVGYRPTFKTERIFSETHIFDFNKDVYGKNARITLEHFLRDEHKFNSIDELKEAVELDKKSALLKNI